MTEWQGDGNGGRDRTTFEAIVQAAIQEFVKAEQSKAEPAYKAELGRNGGGGRAWSSG